MINLIFKKIIKKNIRFKDIYKDQECYIIGNGSSLKRYDLNLFSNKKIITCNWMLLHKDFKKLKNVVAYIACSPFWFAPFKKHPYSRKIEYNRSNNIFFRNFKGIEIPLFTSITNIFFLKNINKVLLHDFKLKEINLDYNLLHEKFSLLRYFIVFVALPIATGKNPLASGSNVPTYPALAFKNNFLIF